MDEYGGALDFISNRGDYELTEEVCFYAVSRSRCALKFVPEKLQSERICVFWTDLSTEEKLLQDAWDE